MAGSLNAWYLYDQPLDGEVAHFEDDIIVEGSDAEDSTSTKAERQRRREAIGRRYLQGHTPHIQSASLHGPFGPESGWKNPWKRLQKAELAQAPGKPSRAIHESKRALTPLGERKPNAIRGELQKFVPAEGETSGEPPLGYSGPRGEDNGDKILENTHWAGYNEDRNGLDQRGRAKGSRIISTASEQARNKRKADASWLKGMNMLKRSRYEILEHSSPTPAAGTGRTINAQALPSSSSPVSCTMPQNRLQIPMAINVDQAYKEIWSSSINVNMALSAARNLSDMDQLTAHHSEDSEGNDLRQTGQPLKNESGLTFVCNETAFNNIGVEDGQGLHKVSHLPLPEGNSPVPTSNILQRQLEIAELSSSDPDGEDTTPVTEVPQRFRQKAGPLTNTVIAQDIVRHEVSAKHSNNSPISDTSASEGSFQYRRRNRILKRKKISPCPKHTTETERNVEELSNQKETQGREYAIHSTASLEYKQNSQKRSKSYNNNNSEKNSEIYAEYDQPVSVLSNQEELSHGNALEIEADGLLKEPDNIGRNRQVDVDLEGLQSGFSRGSSSSDLDNEESHNDTEIGDNNAYTDDVIPNKLYNDVQKQLLDMEFISTGENRLNNSPTLPKPLRELSHIAPEPVELFPSTQVLIDAATANPWNSFMKKSKSRKSIKRVSFGPLPSDDIDKSIPQLSSSVTERLKSPPPPEETMLTTHLDDGFQYKLRAAQLETTEESLAGFMKTPREKTSAMKSRAKPSPHSPAVGAMAEAFIAADRENMPGNSDMKGRTKPIRSSVKKTNPKVTAEFWSRTAPQQHQIHGHSPRDASFSIAPSGKVTAVNFEKAAFDAEDSLDAMIDDVGSFFEGWDVDSELKKAKEIKPEKRPDHQNSSCREYLSGLSNR